MSNVATLSTEDVGVKKLFFLSLPLILLRFSTCAVPFLDSYFLAHYSLEALQAYTLALTVIAFFQNPMTQMGADTQIFVSQACGSGSEKEAGVYIWQVVWLALFSIPITILVGYVVGELFFQDSYVGQLAKNYFHVLLLGNVLFPLVYTMDAFYAGIGRTKVLWCTAQGLLVLHAVFAFLLIPKFGMWGAAVGCIAAKLLYCAGLACLILQKKHRGTYGTNRWRPKWKPMLSTMRISLVNGLGSSIILFGWLLKVQVLKTKGDDFLTILSFGNSCILFFCFWYLGLARGATIFASQLIGAKCYENIWILLRSFLFISISVMSILFPFLVLYPDVFLESFFSNFSSTFSPEVISQLRISCTAVWVFLLMGSCNLALRSVLAASGDSAFLFGNSLVVDLLFSSMIFYLLFELLKWPAETIWFAVAATTFLRTLPMVVRIRQGKWKTRPSLVAS